MEKVKEINSRKQVEIYIEKILKNGSKSTFIKGVEWYCENYNKQTGEYCLKRIDGAFITDFYNDDEITLKDFGIGA